MAVVEVLAVAEVVVGVDMAFRNVLDLEERQVTLETVVAVVMEVGMDGAMRLVEVEEEVATMDRGAVQIPIPRRKAQMVISIKVEKEDRVLVG